MSVGDGLSFTDVISDEERLLRFERLTPMQQLVLEVLAARFRLGHKIWTFTTNQGLPKAIKVLREQGYVEVIQPVVQGTIRVMLTTTGQALVLDPEYTPPILSGEDNVKEKHDPHAT